MITASIVPTRPLRAGIQPQGERKIPTRLRDGLKATAADPVVLPRGCTPIDLRVNVHGSPRVRWAVQPLASNQPGLAPLLFPPVSLTSQLTTNAVGLYRVTAFAMKPGGAEDEHHWHVRFIDLCVPTDPYDIDEDPFTFKYDDRAHLFVGGAAFGFEVRIQLSGAADAPSQYDKITTGILQNLCQQETDPGCKPLQGLYYRIDDDILKMGCLIEPVPNIASPHLDSDAGNDAFPFMNSGHATVKPSGGQSRCIALGDEPGVTLPPYIDLSGSLDRKQWYGNMPNTSSKTCYALCGFVGHLTFCSAVAAFSIEAPFCFVVFEKYDFSMNVNAKVDEKTLLQAQRRPMADPHSIGLPMSTPCFVLTSYLTLLSPCDAKLAGMETYGPTATKGGSIYTWRGLPDKSAGAQRGANFSGGRGSRPGAGGSSSGQGKSQGGGGWASGKVSNTPGK